MYMAFDVALGMEHLSRLHFIHRDLAARNVLVADGKLGGRLKNASTGASLVCKIADFGLSRGGDGGVKISDDSGGGNASYYKSSNGVFPTRWTAPEAMEQHRFTQAFDVWSFGVFLVELLQDGTNPYHGQSNPDVMTMVLSEGRHPKPSADCPVGLYNVMLTCWHEDVAQRPTFAKAVPYFRQMSEDAVEDAANPATAPRMGAHKRVNGFDNQYNDVGFDNDGTQSPRGGGGGSSAAGGTPSQQGGDLSAADEMAGYMVTTDGAAHDTQSPRVYGCCGDAVGFVLAAGEADVYAGFPAGAAPEEETEFGFGLGDDE